MAPSRRLPVVDERTALAPDDGPPPFERIGIVGVGLIGGSIALAARERWPSALVIGVDRNDVLERAMVRHAIDVGADDLGMLAEADLVVLAAPVQQNIALIDQLPTAIERAAVVTDVGSTKRSMVAAASSLPTRLPFVGGHPLAGSADSGVDAAAAGLFIDRPWVLTPAEGMSDEVVARVAAFVGALGARPLVVDPARHDAVLAFVSHLPQLTATALMRVVGEAVGEDGLALASDGLDDMTRLAASLGEIWSDVCATNGDHVAAALDLFIGELLRARSRLDDREDVLGAFEAAAHWRSRLRTRDV